MNLLVTKAEYRLMIRALDFAINREEGSLTNREKDAPDFAEITKSIIDLKKLRRKLIGAK